MQDVVKKGVVTDLLSLPAIPDTANRVLKLLRNPNTDAAEVERAIRYDPGLTGNVLRLANSAYFGFPGRIESVRHAVVCLGWKRVFQLVVASSVYGLMAGGLPGYGLAPGDLWRHAVAVSLVSEELGKLLKAPVPEETYTAAILHDVGKLAMGNLAYARLAEIEEAIARGSSFEAAEREVLGTDHAQVGADILRRWSFPSILVDTVRWHHDPESTPDRTITLDVVHVADALCLMLGIGSSRRSLEDRWSPDSERRLELTVTDLDGVAERALGGLDELMEALKFNPGTA